MKLCERHSGPSLVIALRYLLTAVVWLPAILAARPVVAAAQDNFTCEARSLAAVPPPAPPSLPPTLRQLAVESQSRVAMPEMKPLCAEGQVPAAVPDARYFHKGNPLIGPYAASGPEHALPKEFVQSNLLRSFDQVYGKSGGSAGPSPRSTALPPAPACNGVAWFNACYFYTNAAETPSSFDGGGMTLEIVAPIMDEDNYGGHSIGQIAVESGGTAGSTLDDVEMGFSVAPNQWGNNNPHLFVYHFIGTGETCYDTCDWNQYSSTYFPGMDLGSLVGQQVYLGWVHYQGAWWAWFNNQWLGYINDSVWSNKFTQTALIQWYGEIAVVDGYPPRSQMGTGQFSAMTTAASLSTMCAVNAGIWECDYDDHQSAAATQTAYYDILNHSTFGAVRYGGPGETIGAVPAVTVSPSSASITATQPVTVTVTVAGTNGNPTPTGPINLVSGSYTTFWWYTLANGSASINIPAGSLPAGNDTLTVNYAPDVASAWTYNYASGTAAVSVTAVAPSISFAAANQTYGTAPFLVAATSNSSGAITYSVVSGPATITGSTVTLTGTGPVVLQASQAAAGIYTAGTQTATFTVLPSTSAAITFSVPNHTYGDAPFAVTATSASSGAITYSVVSGPATLSSGSAVTLTGAGTVVLQANQAATGSYTAGAQIATFTVAPESQTITFVAPASPVNFGVAPIPLSASSTSGLAVTFSVLVGPASVSGSTLTITGGGAVIVAADQPGNTNYAAAVEKIQTIVVNKIVPVAGLTVSPNPVLVQNAATLTATVVSAVGTPTGSVVFSDGSTALGTVNLSGGVATLAVSTLTAGSHAITALYGGDGSFTSVSSAAVGETVEDFTLTGGTGSSQTVQPGGTASYTLPMSPSGGTTFPAAVTLSTSGVPAGFTATFSPSSIAAGSSATNVGLTIQVPVTAMLEKGSRPGRGVPLVALAVLMLPFVAGIKRSGNGQRLAVIVMMVAVAALTGCGGGSGGGGGGSSQPQTYTITVNATSGTLSHSTTLTLTVE